MNHVHTRRSPHLTMNEEDFTTFRDIYIRARTSPTTLGTFLRLGSIGQCMVFGVPALLTMCCPLLIPIGAGFLGLCAFGIFCVHVYVWYTNLVKRIKRFYRKLVRRVQNFIQTILSIIVLFLNVVFLPFIIIGMIKTRVNNTRQRLHQLRRNVCSLDLQTLLRMPFGIYCWLSTSAVPNSRQRFDNARKLYVDERLANVRRQMDQHVANVRRHIYGMYEFVDELFGNMFVTVSKLRNKAEILVESYSRLPVDIVAKTVRDQIRSTIQIDLVREWIRENVEIPVVVVDKNRRTQSLFALRVTDDVVSIRRCQSDSKLDVRY